MTPEEIAEKHATWQEQRDAADSKRNACIDQLTEEQRSAIENAYKTIRDAENSMREMFDLTLNDARSIEHAEWKLRQEFPSLCNMDL